jgi:hypothetical protein
MRSKSADSIKIVNLCADRGRESLILIINSPRISKVRTFVTKFQENNSKREPVKSVRYNWHEVATRILKCTYMSRLLEYVVYAGKATIYMNRKRHFP